MPLYLDLCTENYAAPHVIFRTRLSLAIQGQLGELVFFIFDILFLLVSDALNVHTFTPVEVFVEPRGVCGIMRVMLIICPVISRFQIPYFNSQLYLQTLG